MTTTINDISDLARILAERPEWAETLRSLLLSRAVLEQPEKMAQLTANLDQFARETRESNRELREFVQETRERNRQADARMDQFDQFIQETREHNRQADARLEQFIQETREHNRQADARLEQFIQETREHDRQANARMGLFEARLDRFENRLGRLMGDALENRLHGRIVPLIAGRFNLRRPIILKSRFFQLDPELYDQLDAAEEAGRITPRQSGQLQQTDFILRGLDKATREPVYVVVETSRTINEHDITRARERADILAAVTGGAARPAAAGNLIAEPQESQAADWSVTIIQVPEPEPED